MKKALAIVNVLLIAAVLAFADVDVHPTPPVHPDAVPDPSSPLPTEVHPGFLNYTPASGTVPSVYDDATACWSFNDPTDLGNDDCANTYDLTLVNTPTATSGALGYAVKLASASSEYAEATDSANTSIGAGVSWGFAAWIRVDTSDARAVVAKGDAMDTEGDFDGVFTLGGVFTCRLIDSAGAKTDTHGTVTSGAREFVACRYNATTNELEAGEAGTWSGSATSTASDGADLADKLTVGANTGGTNPVNGTIGPVWWYRSASGGEVLTDAYATSLYNSGKGKTCSDTTETTNLVSCWDMTEDGGPYADSIGSNTLTGVNTPTRAPGLVEQSESGMGGYSSVVTVSQQYFKSAISSVNLNVNDVTIAGWVNLEDLSNFWRHIETSNGAISLSQISILGPAGATNMRLRTYDATGAQDCNTPTNAFPSNAALGGWHFMVVRGRKDASEVRLDYDDGTYYATCDPDSWSDISTGASLVLALQSKGAYDNFGVWSSWLSDTDVATLYNSGAGTFYAAFWDAYFSGDPILFAWSARPEIRRMN